MASRKRHGVVTVQRRHVDESGRTCIRVLEIVDGKKRFAWRSAERLELPVGRVRLEDLK